MKDMKPIIDDNKALERAEVIAALRCCESRECSECPYQGCGIACKYRMMIDAADLLGRYTEPPNDPLTLEELRGMDGKPVWVERLDGDIPWGTYSIVWAATRLATNGYVRFHFEKYGETWLAYHRKPDGGGE